ncbi:hypothetical protein EF096_10040 [Pseudomonas neustonica]|uniref:Cytochrome b561 bacterial/Ni-hydrogenase domain-containing protein n=2 Tax=Pseudomonas TaxID=286 RepID=A0ABX9XHW9_9PSED|nr:hypothetical protein [Pseudomonadales bacterium]ROZ82776.1 hypothetical protein EF099_11180 [Pseudomonas sp. SSM44]ROZ84728.1 hypothetical protein EF096_10040 [Pseudomonas neustonica]|tara:strand:- start:1547 stop:2101 length:555 start_codon:yes stop_codon:yes gene_type:complete
MQRHHFFGKSVWMETHTPKYDATARLLHWISAAVILWATLTGFSTLLLANDSALKHVIADFNVSLTTLFIPVFLCRVIYRLRTPSPSYNNQLSTKEAGIAKVAHCVMYILVTLVLLSGVLMMTKDIELFHLIAIPQMVHNDFALALLKKLHTLATVLLGIGIILHLAAVVKHELAGKTMLRRIV